MKGTVDQWNQKFKFVSDGTWFKQGTQAKLVCWYANEPDIDTPLQDLQKLQNVAGLFSGIRVCEYQYQLKIWSRGYERQDEQGCGLDQFQITYRVPNLDGISEVFQIPGHSPHDIQNLPGVQEEFDDYHGDK